MLVIIVSLHIMFLGPGSSALHHGPPSNCIQEVSNIILLNYPHHNISAPKSWAVMITIIFSHYLCSWFVLLFWYYLWIWSTSSNLLFILYNNETCGRGKIINCLSVALYILTSYFSFPPLIILKFPPWLAHSLVHVVISRVCITQFPRRTPLTTNPCQEDIIDRMVSDRAHIS